MLLTTAPPQRPLMDPRTVYDKEGREYVVRSYTEADREDLQRFYDEFQPKRRAQGLPPHTPDRVAAWLDGVLNEGMHLVARLDGALVGHALVVATGRPGVGEYAIFLREDIRGRGLGTELNLLVVEEAKATGSRGLWLTVEPHNRAAIRSYEKAGFHFVPGTIFSLEAEMELDF